MDAQTSSYFFSRRSSIRRTDAHDGGLRGRYKILWVSREYGCPRQASLAEFATIRGACSTRTRTSVVLLSTKVHHSQTFFDAVLDTVSARGTRHLVNWPRPFIPPLQAFHLRIFPRPTRRLPGPCCARDRDGHNIMPPMIYP